MATTITKDGTGGPVAKPRRGAASPSDNGTGTRRGLLSSEKSVPNYLRPTISSCGETPKELKKKPLSSPDNRKPVLARRSSFDRPPAASHLQKIISSGPGERSVTVRSSSFSGRSGNLHRPVSERTSTGPSRTVKAVSRTHLESNVGGKVIAKKSSPTASASSSLATKNKEKSSDAPAVVDDASGNDNSGVSSVANSEKLPSPTKVETEEFPEPSEAEDILVKHEDSEVVHEENHDVAHSENDVVDKKEIFADDGAVLVTKEEDEKNSATAAQPQMEEVRVEIKDKEEIVSDDSKGEEKEVEVPKGITEATEAEAEAEVEEEDKKENNPVVEGVVVAAKEEKEAGDAAKNDEDSAALISGSEKPSEEKEGEAANVEDEKQAAVVEAEKTVVKQRIEKPAALAAPAKKDPVQANNDIIEETTKKLMESSRKNKVKAMAGAFETVISLEKPGQV